jgi:hypothetical protein|nr:MAG TPA: helix-turn-helix domain protein [Caudoviricetes sp.]
MAARLTDKQKKKIVVDYLETQSYSATARLNGVTHQTVKRIVQESPDFSEKLQQKKDMDTADIIAYMESKRDAVYNIIEVGLRILPEKIETAKSATEVTTALGTLIDKWTLKSMGSNGGNLGDDDPITKALKEKYGRTI